MNEKVRGTTPGFALSSTRFVTARKQHGKKKNSIAKHLSSSFFSGTNNERLHNYKKEIEKKKK